MGHIIIDSESKLCELYPLPTVLLQEHVDLLLPLLMELCNQSIWEDV